MKINATAVLTRCSGGDELRPYRLSIRDSVAGVEFAELRMTPEELALVLTAHSTPGIECVVRGLDRVGTKLEVKEVVVPFSPYGANRENTKSQREALAPFEVDGWQGCADDLCNGHRSVRGTRHAQRVTFTRNVPVEGASAATRDRDEALAVLGECRGAVQGLLDYLIEDDEDEDQERARALLSRIDALTAKGAGR